MTEMVTRGPDFGDEIGARFGTRQALTVNSPYMAFMK